MVDVSTDRRATLLRHRGKAVLAVADAVEADGERTYRVRGAWPVHEGSEACSTDKEPLLLRVYDPAVASSVLLLWRVDAPDGPVPADDVDPETVTC